ncbi:hypothetical protein SLEP1_g2543 [Rubroshorea leprosula]|uniref:Uncharacterized protein n=1 Tax=Rubroshorea leprosula TaxID=152421 RepID=A0AAV5HPT6_9ROSI|nr:hypothetical protein SLEP1_g2543 [Rubroshorea leprosula]
MATDRDGSNGLNHDVLLEITTRLDDPSDIGSVFSAVPGLLNGAIDNHFAKTWCLKKFPQLSRVDHVVEDCCIPRKLQVEAGSGNMERETLKGEHRVYSLLARGCMSSAELKDCIARAIMASSTDHYPLESIENTLEEGVAWRPSYWSSEGQISPAVPETLTYKLVADLCVITEIRIRPFQANFEPGSPIFSAKSVLFRMGHSLGDDYVWTYISEQFPMDQVSSSSSIALIEMDYYFSVSCESVARVQVVGRPLSLFGVEIREDSEKFVLKALSCTHPPLPEETREDDSAQGLDCDVDSAQGLDCDVEGLNQGRRFGIGMAMGLHRGRDPLSIPIPALSCTHPPLPEETREDDSAQGLDWDVEGLTQERWFSIGMAMGPHRGKDPLPIPIPANGGYGDFCRNLWRRVKNCFRPRTCKK